MPHEIETHTDGTAAFVSARKPAWHQLGTVLPDTFTAEQAMTEAHLAGWNVRKAPLTAHVMTGDGVTSIDVPKRYATVRTSPFTGQPEALGTVGEHYVPIQNEELTAFLDALVDESGAHYETAGSLFDGRRVFLSMKLPDHMLIGGVDQVDTYIVATNSHDGTSALQALVTPVRVVCNNTLSAALSTARHSWKIRHTQNAPTAVNQAREALDLTFRYISEFQAAAEKMIQTPMTVKQFKTAAKQVIRRETASLSKRQQDSDARVLDAMTKLFTKADTQANIRNTRWAGFNAVTEYQEHIAPVHAKGRDQAVVRAERLAAGQLSDAQRAAFRVFAVA